MTDDRETPEKRATVSWQVKLVCFLAIVIVAMVAYRQWGDLLSLANLARQEARLKSFQLEHPVFVHGAALLIYVSLTAVPLPGAAALSLVYGWYFGLFRGVILVSFASTAGATLAFLLSRFLLRDAIQAKFGSRLANFNQALEKEGAFYLFTLRLIPAVPFFVINAVMGLTRLRAWTFWWVSQLGMFPGTIVYIYAGSRVPNLKTLAEKGINSVFSPAQLTQILAAFVLLGLFPLIVRLAMKWITGKNRMKLSVIESTQVSNHGT